MVVLYEDVHERVAASVLKVRTTDNETDVPLAEWLQGNGSFVEKIMYQLLAQYKSWCAAGVHNPGLCVDACVMDGTDVVVTDWTSTELCDGNADCCARSASAFRFTLAEMICVAKHKPFLEDDCPLLPAFEMPTHVPFVSRWQRKPMTLAVAAVCKFAGLNALGYAFVSNMVPSGADTETVGAAVLLAHKLYGRDEDDDVTPPFMYYAVLRRVSMDSILDAEQKLFDSFVAA